MQPLRKKVKRLEPLLKIRQDELDRESLLLAQIRSEKQRAVADLRENQRIYIEGVDALNHERQSGVVERLLTLEAGLDQVKGRWYDTLQKLRDIEAREREQVAQVVAAQVGVRSLERLGERYEHDIALAMKRSEEKEMDEIATRSFLKGRFA